MELQAYSDAQRSFVETQYHSTYEKLHFRISTIPTLKSTEVVGNSLGARSQPALKSESGRFSIVTGLVVVESELKPTLLKTKC